MLILIVLPLLALLPNSFVSAPFTSPSFIPFISAQKGHINYLTVALGGSSASQGLISPHHHHAHKIKSHSVSPSPSAISPGSLSSPTPSTSSGHHRHAYISRGHAVSPLPSTTTSGCGAACSEPFVSAPFSTPCACVLPMKVRLRLGVSVFSIFPVVSELAIEVAAGTFLKQSQVTITGATADDQNQEKSVVDFNLLPLGGTFDNTTITLNYQRFFKKKVTLNMSLFGDYDVLLITYPGLPDLTSSGTLPGAGPIESTINHQYPIAADIVDKNKKWNHGIILIITLSASVLLVVCFGAVAILVNNRKFDISLDAAGRLIYTKPMEKRTGKESMQSSSPPTNSAPVSFVSAMPASILSVKTFSLVELEKATEKFSPEKILGEGGFGRVYHGIMENRTEVAVKLLKRDSQNGDSEFIAEIEMLSRLHHCNLVKLIGICIEECTRCLVYELVPNGSIESHIHGVDRSKGPLDWDVRLKIALGAARGLAYLHEDSNPRVIHRDFKASNVLLEDDFTPKVSDFGLAREATEESDLISTRVMGTFGYVAPEYAMTGHLLVKSDVYSYGVVLLELLTGRKPVDMSQPPGQENLVVWARPLLANQRGLKQLVDPSLAGTYYPDDMARVAAIASMCVHPEVTQRPFMGEVVQALKLICNDADVICGEAYSPDQPSTHYLDINDDPAISEGSWWDPECVTPPQPFVTMELGNSPGLGWSSVEGGAGLPTRHENRSGPLKIIRDNRDYYRLRESMSEHRGLQVKRDLKNVCGYESFF